MSLSTKTKQWLEENAPISLKGKTAVVTGSNSGVGYKTAEVLLYLGANVILACRNPQRANDARNTLAAEYPKSVIGVMALDLADFSSIAAFVEEIKNQKIDIDVFVNNAGAIHHPGEKTKDGFDLVIGTNYIGVYDLTEQMLPYLTSLPHEVTYVNTISLLHKFAKLEYDDFYCQKKKRNTMAVYGRSKICLAKYSYHRARMPEGSNVHIYMNHPGIAVTPLGINMVGPKLAKLAQSTMSLLFMPPEKSALSVPFILSNKLPVGTIVGPNKLLGGWGYPKVNRTFRKVTTGAEELVAFTEKEIKSSKKP